MKRRSSATLAGLVGLAATVAAAGAVESGRFPAFFVPQAAQGRTANAMSVVRIEHLGGRVRLGTWASYHATVGLGMQAGHPGVEGHTGGV